VRVVDPYLFPARGRKRLKRNKEVFSVNES